MPELAIVFLKGIVLVPITLLPIVNPVGNAPIFLSLTHATDDVAARRVARRVGINCLLLLVATLFIGSTVLRLFGISLAVVRVGGGLLVAANGWRLLHDTAADSIKAAVAASQEPGMSEAELAKRSFYPIAFPLTVGPGTISAAITLGAHMPVVGVERLAVGVASALGAGVTASVIFLCYRFAPLLVRRLGDVGTTVLLRLSAFILLCVGVQITWAGMAELIGTLLH